MICCLFKKVSSYKNAVKLEKLEDHLLLDIYLRKLSAVQFKGKVGDVKFTSDIKEM